MAENVKQFVEIVCEQTTSEDDEFGKVPEMLDEKFTTSQDAHLIAKTIRDTLLEIAEVREQNATRRHGELMQLLEKFLREQEPDQTEAQQVKSEDEHEYQSPLEESSLEEVRRKLKTPTGKQPSELHAMRKTMLLVQRQKMAERERKKQKIVK